MTVKRLVPEMRAIVETIAVLSANAASVSLFVAVVGVTVAVAVSVDSAIR